MSAAKLLDRLERVKQTAPGRWIAACPAHEDRSPSLSIRELDDGRILIYDFGLCSTADVLAAVGLSMADLFPKPLRGSGPAGGFAPSHSRIPARDLLEVISSEVAFVSILASDFVEHRGISEENWVLLARAWGRIRRARDHAYGG